MELFSILFKINISLLVGYGVYRFVLRKLTFYHINRVYLISAILFSAALPFIPYQPKVQAQVGQWQQVIGIHPDVASQLIQTETFFSMSQVIAMVYWSGVTVMAIVFCLQLASLLSLYIRSPKAVLMGVKIKKMQEAASPFSFFKTIFVYPDNLTRQEMFAILEHESVHTKQWHSVDVVLAELKRIFCWFNPAAWLICAAIRENLEFIADRKVLQRGVDAKTYQYTLLAAQQSIISGSITNHFNFSHLKFRITMMNKRKTSDINLLKYLLAVPCIVLVFLITNYTYAYDQQLSVENVKPQDQGVVTDKAAPANQLNEPVSKPPASSKVAPLVAAKDDLSSMAANSEKGEPRVQSAAVRAKATLLNEQQPIINSTDETAAKDQLNKEDIVYFLNGKRTAYVLDELDAADIVTMSVFKGAQAQKFDPSVESGKAVISITTKDAISPVLKTKQQ